MSDIEDDENYSYVSGGDSDGEDETYKKINSFVKKTKKGGNRPTLSDDDDEDDVDEDENKNIDDDDEMGDVEVHVDDDDEIDIDDEDEDEDDEEDDDTDDEDDNDNDDNDDNDDSKNKNKSGGAKPVKNKVNQDKKQNTIHPDVEDYDDDDDDDYQDDNYLQKFDKEITKDYILDFHPECLNHNYDEIKSLSKVTRDEFNIIIDPLHKTVPFLTKYEKARILGQRAKQIECGAKPLVKVPENIIDSYLIAELELEQKAIPFIIRRPIPSGGSEYWNLKDLEIISF